MFSKIISAATLSLFLLTACGFKGDLYLPKKNDDATFGPVQTGVGLTPPAASEAAASEAATNGQGK